MKKIMLIRHPEIQDADKLKYFGNTDIPLSKTGYTQAHDLCKFLSRRQIENIYCSHLQRTKYPAGLLSNKFDLPVNITPQLGEVNFGRWEGKSFAEMMSDNKQLFSDWWDMKPDFRFPDGERLADFYNRITAKYKRIVDSTPDTDNGEFTVIITHGGVIKLLLAELLQLSWDRINFIKLDFGALNIIEYQNGYAVLRLLNDTCYLKAE